jgi:hypothetical protein
MPGGFVPPIAKRDGGLRGLVAVAKIAKKVMGIRDGLSAELASGPPHIAEANRAKANRGPAIG